MRENDDLKNIPPMVPDREDVDSYRSNRKSQEQDIVRPSYYAEKVKVSTWQVRTLLTLIILVLGAAGYGGYYMYGLYEVEQRQTQVRIGDLERLLAAAGESSTESEVNIFERMDFNFSEIDKLWGARNTTNSAVDDVRSEIAKLALVNEGQDETAASNSRQIANSNETIMAANTRLNSLNAEFERLVQSVSGLNASVQDLETMRGDLSSIRQALNSGDSTVLGLLGRLEFMESSMESVNAHRLQINQSLFRLQENIESLQSSVGIPGANL